MINNLEFEINSNLVLSKAYESMIKLEIEIVANKLKVLSNTHLKIAEHQRKTYTKIKSLAGKEVEDYYKLTIGAFEAIERRNRIRSESSNQEVDIQEINETLKSDLDKFYEEKNVLAKSIGTNLVVFKRELSVSLSEIWKESYNTIKE